MAKTKKQILVAGRNVDEVFGFVQNWFSQNKIGVIEHTTNYIKGRWGSGFLTAPKYFQVTLTETADGVLAETEGWITVYGVSDQDFSPKALGGGLPRREGWRTMERLWSALEGYSKAT